MPQPPCQPSGPSAAASASPSPSPAVARVMAALAAGGASGQPTWFDQPVPTAAVAAEVLGCEVGAIANSLVFEVAGAPFLVLASGAARVDTALVAAQLDLPPLRRASAELVLEHTGQVVGGVAPVGHPRPIPTVVDVALREHAVVWAGAGDVRTMFPTTFTELVTLTGGRPLQVR